MIIKCKKQTIVMHSGGMDSTICLALAIREFGKDQVLSLSFNYGQRHSQEFIQAKKICADWGVDHTLLSLECLKEITQNALMNSGEAIIKNADEPPNTLVIGRNGLMAQLCGIQAGTLGAGSIYMGIMELEEANSGYRDCSRSYMDLKQQILRIDLDNPLFEIRTPLVFLTKLQTFECAQKLGILDYLLENTVTCYQGIMGDGCQSCPSCILRNRAKKKFFNL
jgi:7-cyano-7-deazaguanine synthase